MELLRSVENISSAAKNEPKMEFSSHNRVKTAVNAPLNREYVVFSPSYRCLFISHGRSRSSSPELDVLPSLKQIF